MLQEVGKAAEFANFSSFLSTTRCAVSVAPGFEYICFTSGKQLILWSSESGKISKFALSDNITCCEFITISGMGKVIKKILCVLVALHCGELVFLSIPTGAVFLEQKFHDQPIVQIKSRTVATIPLVGTEEQDEELLILFDDSTLVIIEGDSLMTCLRSEYMKKNNIRCSQEPVGLTFRKYKFKHTSSTRILDVISTGSNGIRETSFGTMIVAVGKNPMVSVYLSCKDSGSLITLASNVASKLTSSIVSFAKSWWGAPAPIAATEVPEVPIPKSSKISRVTQLEDPSRKILCIVQDGTSRLAAFGDALGRVCLLDINYSPPIVIRMWKGYRDAQLGFFQCEMTTKTRPTANKKQKTKEIVFYQYLVIYAPRRGLLEIWKVRNGSRQAVFSVGEDSLLVNDSACFGLDPSRYGSQNCYLINKSTGLITQITIDPSLHGTSEKSQKQLARFVKLVECLDSGASTMSSDVICSVHDELVSLIPSMDGPEQFAMMTQRILAVAFAEGSKPIAFPLDFLLSFMTAITKDLEGKMKPKKDKTNLRTSTTSVHSIQELRQLQRIQSIIFAIQTLNELDQMYSETSKTQNEISEILFSEYLSIELPPNSLTNQNDENPPIQSEINIMLLNMFDVNSGKLKTQQISNSMRELLFHWILLPEKEDSTKKFLTVFQKLAINARELQSLFAFWFLSLSLPRLSMLSKWNTINGNSNNDSLWSLEIFIQDVILCFDENECEMPEMDPLDSLFHRCADSCNLYNVLVLIKAVLHVYHEGKHHGSDAKRNSIKRWTVLKGKVSRLIDLYNTLPETLLQDHPLSVASFETTASVYYYKALLHIAEAFPALVTIPKDFDIPITLEKITEQFPDHHKLTETKILTFTHEIVLLASLWFKSIENTNQSDVTPLVNAIIKLKDLSDNPELHKGISLLIWQENVSGKASALVSTIEKVRKMPKQRMLQRTIGMDTCGTKNFLNSVEDLLELLLAFSDSGNSNAIVYRPVVDDSDVWPPCFDSLYYRAHRLSCDAVCDEQAIRCHLLLIKIVKAIQRYDLQQVQPLQLFGGGVAFFSQFSEISGDVSDEEDALLESRRCQFLSSLMNHDISLALEFAEAMKVSRDNLLISSVQYLYGLGNLEQARKVMKLSDSSLFASVLGKLSKERIRMLLIDQPYVHKHLSEESKHWIDENFEQRPPKECQVADADTMELYQQQTEIIHDLLCRLLDAIGSEHSDASCVSEILDICSIMKSNTFSEWYEESYEEEQEEKQKILVDSE